MKTIDNEAARMRYHRGRRLAELGGSVPLTLHRYIPERPARSGGAPIWQHLLIAGGYALAFVVGGLLGSWWPYVVVPL